MKNLTDSRILRAKDVSKETLIETIKTSDSIRFDQMLIESEERKTYYYVKYKSLAYTREPKTLKFPLFKDLVNDFESAIDQSGQVKILEDDRLIQKVISKGYTPSNTQKYSGKNLVFSELKLVTDGDKIKIKQPFYYLPEETERCTCNTCDGDKYVECSESECRGQHIYECKECRGQGETNCPTCKGTGRLKCKGYVGNGSGGPASNAVYSCQNGRCKCDSCDGSGYKDGKRCYRRCDRGWITCPTCNGAGDVPCELKYASSYGIGKLTDLATGKTFCKGKGTITCVKCKGNGEIVCKTCYGDHIDNRYGKIDCKTCETAGELASISYIETEIKSDSLDLIVTDGKKIVAPNFGVETIKKFTDANGQLIQTYKNLNGDNYENYDDYSSLCSKNALAEVGDYKDRYPKLISEEMYYEGVPSTTFNYNHILSSTFHDVSVLNIDKTKEVIFHSNPADVAEEKESFKDKLNEWFRQAFSTKSYKDKIDRKHEMFLMVHMAKADGIIEEQEKRYLSQTITGLQGFTKKEKVELFSLMSANTLPPILPTNAYFSTKERAEEARKKIIELVAKADGEYEPQEKTKLVEINNAIELGYKAKPSALGRFFKTWQISGAIFLSIIIISLTLYYSLIVFPLKSAKTEHSRLLLDKQKLEYFLSTEKNKTINNTDTIYDIYEAKDILNNLVHNSELHFINEKKEISYKDYWKSEYDKLRPLLLQYESICKEKETTNVNSPTTQSDEIEFTEAQDDIIVEGVAEKVYFYDKPNSDSKTKGYFVKGQQAKLLGAAGDFSKVRFEFNGKVTEKFVLTYQISEIDTYVTTEPDGEEVIDPEYQEQ